MWEALVSHRFSKTPSQPGIWAAIVLWRERNLPRLAPTSACMQVLSNRPQAMASRCSHMCRRVLSHHAVAALLVHLGRTTTVNYNTNTTHAHTYNTHLWTHMLQLLWTIIRIHKVIYFHSSPCTWPFSKKCLTYEPFKHKKTSNPRDESVLCLLITDRLAGNLF